jgi:hypothetical protein
MQAFTIGKVNGTQRLGVGKNLCKHLVRDVLHSTQAELLELRAQAADLIQKRVLQPIVSLKI